MIQLVSATPYDLIAKLEGWGMALARTVKSGHNQAYRQNKNGDPKKVAVVLYLLGRFPSSGDTDPAPCVPEA